MADKPHDLVLFGATGFAGRLVAEYLSTRGRAEGLSWAIAGRSADKLAALAADLGRPDLPRIVADSADRASLDAMCAATRVVCTTVGPYARYGADLVAAAVAAKTHYCDLTGEPQFVRRMIDRHHAEAEAAGVRIVHCCGFDSVPSDLGVWVLQQAAAQRHGRPCPEVEMVVLGASGGVSGGTLASMGHLLDEASDPQVRRVLADPYSLAGSKGPDTREQRAPRYSDAAGAWTAPFVMAAVNERVVRRSNALLDHAYGDDFRYRESMRTRSGLRGRLSATAVAAGLGLGTAAMAIGPVRRLLFRTVLPAPGQGPSPDQIERGYFEIRLFGHHPDGRVDVVVTGRRDPGYGATACMLAESALCLASDDLQRAGVLTPAVAFGQALVDRLDQTDVQFTVTP